MGDRWGVSTRARGDGGQRPQTGEEGRAMGGQGHGRAGPHTRPLPGQSEGPRVGSSGHCGGPSQQRRGTQRSPGSGTRPQGDRARRAQPRNRQGRSEDGGAGHRTQGTLHPAAVRAGRQLALGPSSSSLRDPQMGRSSVPGTAAHRSWPVSCATARPGQSQCPQQDNGPTRRSHVGIPSPQERDSGGASRMGAPSLWSRGDTEAPAHGCAGGKVENRRGFEALPLGRARRSSPGVARAQAVLLPQLPSGRDGGHVPAWPAPPDHLLEQKEKQTRPQASDRRCRDQRHLPWPARPELERAVVGSRRWRAPGTSGDLGPLQRTLIPEEHRGLLGNRPERPAARHSLGVSERLQDPRAGPAEAAAEATACGPGVTQS